MTEKAILVAQNRVFRYLRKASYRLLPEAFLIQFCVRVYFEKLPLSIKLHYIIIF